MRGGEEGEGRGGADKGSMRKVRISQSHHFRVRIELPESVEVDVGRKVQRRPSRKLLGQRLFRPGVARGLRSLAPALWPKNDGGTTARAYCAASRATEAMRLGTTMTLAFCSLSLIRTASHSAVGRRNGEDTSRCRCVRVRLCSVQRCAWPPPARHASFSRVPS